MSKWFNETILAEMEVKPVPLNGLLFNCFLHRPHPIAFKIFGPDILVGASMMGGSHDSNQNSNDSSNDIESETETDEDDEIDVVGTNSDLGGSSARTRHCNLAINRANKNQKHHLKQQNNDQSR